MSDPGPIKDSLNSLAVSLGLEHPWESAQIFSRWEAIVGPEVANRCRPVSLKAGILTVKTDSAAWASELRYLGPEVVRRVNQELGRQPGSEVVREVKATVSIPDQGGGPRRAEASGEEQTGDALGAAHRPPGGLHPGLAEALEKARLAAKMRPGERGPRGRI